MPIEKYVIHSSLIASSLFITFSAFLFVLSLIGLFVHQLNLLRLIICLEITFLSCNLSFIAASLFLNDTTGYVYGLFILALTGCEISLGLSLSIVVFRVYTRLRLASLPNLKS